MAWDGEGLDDARTRGRGKEDGGRKEEKHEGQPRLHAHSLGNGNDRHDGTCTVGCTGAVSTCRKYTTRRTRSKYKKHNWNQLQFTTRHAVIELERERERESARNKEVVPVARVSQSFVCLLLLVLLLLLHLMVLVYSAPGWVCFRTLH
jgi:hypothetical protein